jgi:hypothetical protein
MPAQVQGLNVGELPPVHDINGLRQAQPAVPAVVSHDARLTQEGSMTWSFPDSALTRGEIAACRHGGSPVNAK